MYSVLNNVLNKVHTNVIMHCCDYSLLLLMPKTELQAQWSNIIIILSIGHSLHRCHRSNRTNVGESAVCREFKPWMGPTRTLTWHRSETCKRHYSRFVRKVQILLLHFFFSNNIIYASC